MILSEITRTAKQASGAQHGSFEHPGYTFG